MENLVTMTTHVPEETPGQTVVGIGARQAAHSSESAGRGHLLRLWRPPLRPANRARWVAAPPGDLAETQAILKPMSLDASMAVQTAARTPDQIDHLGLAAS
jgi:muconolactone delta-isomerase